MTPMTRIVADNAYPRQSAPSAPIRVQNCWSLLAGKLSSSRSEGLLSTRGEEQIPGCEATDLLFGGFSAIREIGSKQPGVKITLSYGFRGSHG
jgi:hypothetical protein